MMTFKLCRTCTNGGAHKEILFGLFVRSIFMITANYAHASYNVQLVETVVSCNARPSSITPAKINFRRCLRHS